MFGTINNMVSKPTKSIGGAVSERAEKFSRDSVSDGTKDKWNNLKEKSSNINESLTNFIRPAINKYYDLSDQIGQKFYSSENNVIKTIREYSIALADSINEGEKSAHDDHAENKE